MSFALQSTTIGHTRVEWSENLKGNTMITDTITEEWQKGQRNQMHKLKKNKCNAIAQETSGFHDQMRASPDQMKISEGE